MKSDIRIVQYVLRPNRLDREKPNKIAYVIIPYIDNLKSVNDSYEKIKTIIDAFLSSNKFQSQITSIISLNLLNKKVVNLPRSKITEKICSSSFVKETEKEILDKTKEAIQKMNPTFPGMTDKLFASLDDHFEFEQSARQFYSNPATTVPNDQGAFAAFCYGEMISCKEGNQFACVRDAPRYNLY
jgi:hypothetical protein